jgi:hypothetical protein
MTADGVAESSRTVYRSANPETIRALLVQRLSSGPCPQRAGDNPSAVATSRWHLDPDLVCMSDAVASSDMAASASSFLVAVHPRATGERRAARWRIGLMCCLLSTACASPATSVLPDTAYASGSEDLTCGRASDATELTVRCRLNGTLVSCSGLVRNDDDDAAEVVCRRPLELNDVDSTPTREYPVRRCPEDHPVPQLATLLIGAQFGGEYRCEWHAFIACCREGDYRPERLPPLGSAVCDDSSEGQSPWEPFSVAFGRSGECASIRDPTLRTEGPFFISRPERYPWSHDP